MQFQVAFGVFLLAVIANAEIQSSISVKKLTSRDNLPRILGGTPAIDGQFPYAVHIRAKNFCGGSIISPSWVLTNGWCIHNYNLTVDVQLGSVDRRNSYLFISTNDYGPHPLYTGGSTYNIGLINLRHSIAFNDRVKPIALARRSQEYVNFASARLATVIGWGFTSEIGPLSDVMQYAHVVVRSQSYCISFYSPQLVPDSTMCAESTLQSNTAMCYGDEGNPLTMYEYDNDDLIEVQIGVMATYVVMGANCGYRMPAIYTAPQFHWDWISSVTGIPIRP